MKNNFLKFDPTVFVIGNEFEIIISTVNNGLCFIKVGEEYFCEENSGVLPSEKNLFKIRIPQEKLDFAKKYEVVYRQTKERKAYFSEFDKTKTESYCFKPMTKDEEINVYHIADVHYHFDIARKTASYFGDDTDLFIVNGDIGEVETEENYFAVLQFTGDISRGIIPIIFSRGNHDTRGRLAEKFIDYFPSEGKNTFFKFSVGKISGVVLDCGEDKVDTDREYDNSDEQCDVKIRGVNRFHEYRLKQSAFLHSVSLEGDYKIAISHICPTFTSYHLGDKFDIEREIFLEWDKTLKEKDAKLMISGHMHKAFIMKENDERSSIPNSLPVVIGSILNDETLAGAALVFKKDGVDVKITDQNKNILNTEYIKFN